MFTTIHYLLALVLILTVHEWAHAWVALRLGDPTAQRAGRVSLNPLKHLDLLGTVMLFVAGLGWGKPVPVDPRNFDSPVRDQALTALAGPMANLALAVLAAIPFTYLPDSGGAAWMVDFSAAVMDLSLVLFLFNLLPFPPLDGSKFLMLLVPKALRPRYQVFLQRSVPYFLALILLDLWLVGQWLGFSVVWTVVSELTFWMRTAILIVI